MVVLATERRGEALDVIVAPLTTRNPRAGDQAVEVPAVVRAHLRLGDDRCWIVASEVNRFGWPGAGS